MKYHLSSVGLSAQTKPSIESNFAILSDGSLPSLRIVRCRINQEVSCLSCRDSTRQCPCFCLNAIIFSYIRFHWSSGSGLYSDLTLQTNPIESNFAFRSAFNVFDSVHRRVASLPNDQVPCLCCIAWGTRQSP